MQFALTEDQQMIQDAAREFAQNEIAPVAAEFATDSIFAVSAWSPRSVSITSCAPLASSAVTWSSLIAIGASVGSVSR